MLWPWVPTHLAKLLLYPPRHWPPPADCSRKKTPHDTMSIGISRKRFGNNTHSFHTTKGFAGSAIFYRLPITLDL
jgi:hypothetical protein